MATGESEGDEDPYHGFAADDNNRDSYRISTSTEVCEPVVLILGCALFSKFLRHNPVLIDFSELSTRISSFLNLDNVYLCL